MSANFDRYQDLAGEAARLRIELDIGTLHSIILWARMLLRMLPEHDLVTRHRLETDIADAMKLRDAAIATNERESERVRAILDEAIETDRRAREVTP